MDRIKVIDCEFLSAKEIEDLVNDTIEIIEFNDFTVDYIEYYGNHHGHLKTIVIEYSDDV